MKSSNYSIISGSSSTGSEEQFSKDESEIFMKEEDQNDFWAEEDEEIEVDDVHMSLESSMEKRVLSGQETQGSYIVIFTYFLQKFIRKKRTRPKVT